MSGSMSGKFVVGFAIGMVLSAFVTPWVIIGIIDLWDWLHRKGKRP